MLIVLSPSKTLDYESPAALTHFTQPQLLKESVQLIKLLREFSPKRLSEVMSISDKLAQLNAQRYKRFAPPFTLTNARQALFAFKGDVYEGIEVERYTKDDLAFTQEHVRILSGLYGVLRPLDLMQPYRLEMGTKLLTKRGKDLYAFWGARIAKALDAALAEEGSGVLVNLASEEYFKAVQTDALKGRVLTVQFKEKRGGRVQVIGLMAKKARGVMTNWVVRERIQDVKLLKNFKENGYRHDASLSGRNTLVFTR